MNTHTDSDDDRDRHEWDAQERALQDERHKVGPARHDPAVAAYRLIVRALRQPQLDPLPGDFASKTAALAASANALADERFEKWLGHLLFALFVIAVGATAAVFGDKWLSALVTSVWSLTQLVPAQTAEWVVVAAACLGLSILVDHWRRHSHRR